MPKSRDDNFLVRWSRRKQADRGAPTEQPIEETESAATEAGPDSTQAAYSSADHDGRPPRETGSGAQPDTIPEDLADVDVEALSYESDFARFLESDVPEALRKRALRQLWRSDPILANVDGLNDYDEDFSDAALAVKVLETAHKIGRGYLENNDDEAETSLECAAASSTEPVEIESMDDDTSLTLEDENSLALEEEEPTVEPDSERRETET